MKHTVACALGAIALMLTIGGCRDSATNNDKPRDPVETQTTQGKVVSAADFQKAKQVRAQAVGLLENKEWAAAREKFEQLVELLPGSPTSLKNRALAHVLSITDASTDYRRSGTAAEQAAYRTAIDDAMKAIQEFREAATADFDKGLADHLEGLLLVADDTPETGGFDSGLKKLTQAADALPERADFRFAVALAMDGNRAFSMGDSDKTAQLTEQLQKAFELAPTNLFALQRLLKQQALTLRSTNPRVQQQANEITKTLQSAKTLLEPLFGSIQSQHGVNLRDMIDSALSSEDSAAQMGPGMMISNLILPELATKIDQRRLNKNLLEYLALQFDDQYVASHVAPIDSPSLPKSVVSQWKLCEPLAGLSDVTDLQFRDFNLDGIDELLVARKGRFEVYSRAVEADPSLSASWTLLVQSGTDLSVPIVGFFTVDLDRDSDRTISGPTAPVVLQDSEGDRRIPRDVVDKNRFYDTDLDVIGFGPEGACLLQNLVADDGTRQLQEWPSSFSMKDVNAATAADLDADGDLDLIFGSQQGLHVFRCLKTATFEALTESIAGPNFPISGLTQADWDSNVAIDVAAASDDGRSGYLENMLHGRFRWQDLTTENKLDSASFVLQPTSNGSWQMVGRPKADQLSQADLDNDGFPDLIVLQEGRLNWFRGQPDGVYSTEPSQPQFPQEVTAKKFTVADCDHDGDLDIIAVTADSGEVVIMENEGGNENNWITVVARAVYDDPQNDSSRVNMHGIGSVIEVWHGGQRQRQMITQPRTHLGLGTAASADLVRIVWTDGIPQNVVTKDALQGRIAIQTPQILKGSCPYIYTWDGEKFAFFSDCLWAAPLGLVGADGTVAPTREWENLLIPGDALREKDGHYVLQLTEELWEIAYFDQVELIAVDHPADVQIFTNEKVGPPSIANHQIHTAQNIRMPRAIVSGDQRDLLPGLSDLDKNYVQPFENRILQGLTEEWTMEFDLGDLNQSDLDQSEPKPIRSLKLFLTGWIFPTDTSLNLAIHQNPDLHPPMPPVIEIPDGHNGWKVARPFIGFPSGKTKAMVVDITEIFPEGTADFRFRLRSSMELYFDHAFFTLNEPQFEIQTQSCPLAAADLHYRGFSRRRYADHSLFRNGHSPEDYDYQSVSSESRWPTIHGRFTRFGDVTPLLEAHDDQMIVMGPGEEVTVKFTVPDKPTPEGWKRDFVLRNVGFDKDADLNTLYGQTSEPLPFRGMSRYPYDFDQAPNSEQYQNYLRTWQTRFQNEFRFRNAGSEFVRKQNP